MLNEDELWPIGGLGGSVVDLDQPELEEKMSTLRVLAGVFLLSSFLFTFIPLVNLLSVLSPGASNH